MRIFVLAGFVFFLSASSASALSSRERVWVIGPRDTELNNATTMSVMDSTGTVIATLPGQDTIDYLPLFSVSPPGKEFLVTLTRYVVGSVTETGVFKQRVPVKISGAFYVHQDGRVYWIDYAGGLTKTTMLSNGRFKDEFLLRSGALGNPSTSHISVDGLGRVYAAAGGQLYRYNPATHELLNIGGVSPVSLATSGNVAYFVKEQDHLIYKVENDGTFHPFSSLTGVRFVATDAAGDVIALVGAAPQVTLWQITPDEAATQFSSVIFKEVYGLGITHGGRD